MYSHDSNNIEFPDIKNGSYLLEILTELNFASSGFSGLIPLTFQELQAYIQTTQTPLNSWEVNTLKKLSQSYVSQTYDKGINTLPPYSTMKPKKADSKAVKSLFAGIAKVVKTN
ncbi:MAG: hypothetical protein ACO29X_06480 [Arcobacteraceae bacterium]